MRWNGYLLKNSRQILGPLSYGKAPLRYPSPHLCTYSTPANTTLSRQKDLLRFGVPKLEDTLSKYLRSVIPYLNEDEFARTEMLAKEFAVEGGVGKQLQKKLEEKAAKSDNWLDDWWLDLAYLTYRDPVMVWSSPGIAWPKQNFSNDEEYLGYAAKAVAGFIDYNTMIKKQCIPVEMMGKDPLDMEQYFKLMGTTRIPGENKDSLSFNPNSKHIVVSFKNRFFKVPVYDEGDRPLSEESLTKSLRYITEEWPKNNSTSPDHPVGVLTSQNRDKWNKAYQVLKPMNPETLSEIETALLTLHLDGDLPSNEIFPNDDFSRTAALSIHGLGSNLCTGNRWFDKSIQLFVSRSGENGLTYEHSTAEAVVVMAMVNHVISCINGGDKFDSSVSSSSNTPMHLPFKIDDQLKAMIEDASKDADKLINNLDVRGLHFKHFGKSFIKTQRFSPDSFVQMAFQLAFYRIQNTPGCCYESGGLRRYKKGRTDIIRSCSQESVDFARTMLNANNNAAAKFNSLKNAIAAHSAYAKMTVMGQAVDRHLLGIKLVAKETGLPLPALYEDQSFARSTKHRLSTSQVSGKYPAAVCFGPLVEDGYGCCYNIRNDDLLFGMSAMKSCSETSVDKFKEALELSLLEMQEVSSMQNTQSKL